MKPAHRDIPGAERALRFRWDQAQALPWRNGGGTTRELYAWPPGEEWQLRVSVADIERSGPFSAFVGVTRWFAVLDGEGVALDLPGGAVELRPGDAACRFDGDAAPGCRLLAGPTRDLNLMLRHADGGLQPVDDGSPWRPPGSQCGLYTPVAGELSADDDGWQSVPARSLWWWSVAPSRLRFRRDPVARSAASHPGSTVTTSPTAAPATAPNPASTPKMPVPTAASHPAPGPTPTPSPAWWLFATPLPAEARR